MTYGAEFLNEDYVLQINDNFFNYYVLQSGSQATSAISGAGSGVAALTYCTSWLVVSVTGINPIIAFSCPNEAFLYSVTQSGSLFTFYIATFSPIGTNTKYYVYDTVPAAITAGYGMEVYNSSGQVTYSSSRKYFRAVETIQGNFLWSPFGGSPWNNSTYTYPAGRDYAVIQSHLSWANNGGTFSGDIIALCAKAATNGFTLVEKTINSNGRPYVEPYGDLEFVDKVNYTIVDVTGF